MFFCTMFSIVSMQMGNTHQRRNKILIRRFNVDEIVIFNGNPNIHIGLQASKLLRLFSLTHNTRKRASCGGSKPCKMPFTTIFNPSCYNRQNSFCDNLWKPPRKIISISPCL